MKEKFYLKKKIAQTNYASPLPGLSHTHTKGEKCVCLKILNDSHIQSECNILKATARAVEEEWNGLYLIVLISYPIYELTK